MVVANDPGLAEQVVRLKVSWDIYENLAAAVGDESSTRLAYDGETLELMAPLIEHEAYTRLLDLLLGTLMVEWEINLYNTGSTAIKAKPLGAEPDTSYYIQNADKVDGIEKIDLRTSPPPDLVVEFDLSNRRIDKFYLYARLGIPEFWHFSRAGLHGYTLSSGAYVRIESSAVIRGLPLPIVASFLERRLESNRLAVLSDWKNWLRANRIP